MGRRKPNGPPEVEFFSYSHSARAAQFLTPPPQPTLSIPTAAHLELSPAPPPPIGRLAQARPPAAVARPHPPAARQLVPPVCRLARSRLPPSRVVLPVGYWRHSLHAGPPLSSCPAQRRSPHRWPGPGAACPT
jgi:hypothetical protein